MKLFFQFAISILLLAIAVHAQLSSHSPGPTNTPNADYPGEKEHRAALNSYNQGVARYRRANAAAEAAAARGALESAAEDNNHEQQELQAARRKCLEDSSKAWREWEESRKRAILEDLSFTEPEPVQPDCTNIDPEDFPADPSPSSSPAVDPGSSVEPGPSPSSTPFPEGLTIAQLINYCQQKNALLNNQWAQRKALYDRQGKTFTEPALVETDCAAVYSVPSPAAPLIVAF